MKLKDYIEQGYTVLTTGITSRKIKAKYPKVHVVDVKCPVDDISFSKLLVDRYIKEESYVKHLESVAKVVTIVSFNKSFCGDLGDCKAQKTDHGKDNCKTDETNLLEIKLKSLDSVPEVYYRGEKVFDKRLVSIDYHWETTDSSNGNQYINITGYDIDGHRKTKYPSKDSIIHQRASLK